MNIELNVIAMLVSY